MMSLSNFSRIFSLSFIKLFKESIFCFDSLDILMLGVKKKINQYKINKPKPNFIIDLKFLIKNFIGSFKNKYQKIKNFTSYF